MRTPCRASAPNVFTRLVPAWFAVANLALVRGLTTCTSAMEAFLLEAFTTNVINEALQEYIGRGACILDESTGYGPLHTVATHTSDITGALTQLLIKDHKASVLQESSTGTTALHVAAAHGSYTAAAVLTEEASDQGILAQLLAVNGSQGDVALDVAETAANWRIVKLLVGLKSPRLEDTTEIWPGSTSQKACPDKAIDAAVLGDLAALKASVGLKSSRYPTLASCVTRPAEAGRTLLHVAAACADYPDKEGFSTAAGSKEVVEFLLSMGASGAAQDADGNTPVAYATKSNLGSIIALLTKNATSNDLNQVDEFGRTALHMSARAGSDKSVKALLLKGASASIVDIFGYSALDYAKQAKHRKVVEVIEMVLALDALDGDLIWDAAESLWTEAQSDWYIMLLTIAGASIAALCLACGVFYACRRIRRDRKGIVRALRPTDTKAEKVTPGVDSSLRAAANMLQAGSAPDWKVPFGQLMSRGDAQSGSDSDGPKPLEDDSDGPSKRGGRRRRNLSTGTSDRPVVVVAPNSPTGDIPNKVLDSQDLSATDSSISPIKEPTKDKTLPTDLVGQLRKELRQRETARGVRLPTPPMDTTGEMSKCSPTRGLGPDTKRSHQLPALAAYAAASTSGSPAPSLSPSPTPNLTSALLSSKHAPQKTSSNSQHGRQSLGNSRSVSAPPGTAKVASSPASSSPASAVGANKVATNSKTGRPGSSGSSNAAFVAASSPHATSKPSGAASLSSSTTSGISASKGAKQASKTTNSAASSPATAPKTSARAAAAAAEEATAVPAALQSRTASTPTPHSSRRRRSASSTDSRTDKARSSSPPPNVAIPAALRR